MATLPGRAVLLPSLWAALLALGSQGSHDVAPGNGTCGDGGVCPASDDETQLLQVRRLSSESQGQSILEQRFWDEWLEETFPEIQAEKLLPGDSSALQTTNLSALQTTISYSMCVLGMTACPISQMTGPTLVLPGGKTGCINGDPYAFAVVPGDADKLLFYFEGGGACWEATDFQGNKKVVRQCTDSLAKGIKTSGLGKGVQNFNSPRNPLRGYTIVNPIYCSGDLHIGRTRLVEGGATSPQRGYFNVKAALDWTKRNVKGKLSSFVVMGWSAGSIGVQAWANFLLGKFSYRNASVVMDSYVGVFPGNTVQRVYRQFSKCSIPIWDSETQASCRAGKLVLSDHISKTMTKYPNVAFASIQSKADKIQLSFYRVMAASWGFLADVNFQPAQLNAQANVVFARLSMAHPNYVIYLINRNHHCFTQSELFYTSSTSGPGLVPKDLQTPMLAEWLGKLVAHKGPRTQCDGARRQNGPFGGVGFCDQRLLPKVLKLLR